VLGFQVGSFGAAHSGSAGKRLSLPSAVEGLSKCLFLLLVAALALLVPAVGHAAGVPARQVQDRMRHRHPPNPRYRWKCGGTIAL
jgi:hypothetical protein